MKSLEAGSPQDLENVFEEEMIEASRDHYGLNIHDMDYTVEDGRHYLALDYSVSAKATGVPGHAPHFRVMAGETAEEVEEAVESYLEEQRIDNYGVEITNIAHDVDDGTHFTAFTHSKGAGKS